MMRFKETDKISICILGNRGRCWINENHMYIFFDQIYIHLSVTKVIRVDWRKNRDTLIRMPLFYARWTKYI
jgi:hypothetical protein